MALTNAEKVRRHRERQKARKLEELKQPSPSCDLFQRPFFEFFPVDEQLSSQYAQALELAGINPLLFENDSGPETATLDDLTDPSVEGGSSNPFGASEGSSLGKAEVLIGCMLDSALDLASWVNDYKKTELRARIAEIEGSDLSDAGAKSSAFAEVTRLNNLLEQLEKSIRWKLPVWKADGERA